MLFERSGKDKDAEVAQEKQDELFKQIGQLQVENAFLKVPAGVRERTDLVEPENKELTIVRQCELLGISRSTYYYTSVKSYDEWELAVLKAIIEELTPPPFYGYRRMAYALKDLVVTRKQVRRIMKRAGLKAIFPGKNLSKASKNHPKYPYLLHNKKI